MPLLAFSDGELDDDVDTPVLVIEPQAASLVNLKMEHQEEEFAPNAGSPDIKLKTGFFCTCKYFNGDKCSLSFKEDELLSLRMKHLELDNTALDMVVLAQIRSHLHCGQQTVNSQKGVTDYS